MRHLLPPEERLRKRESLERFGLFVLTTVIVAFSIVWGCHLQWWVFCVLLVSLLFIQQQNREERQRQGLEEALGQCTLCGSLLCVYCSFTCHLTCTCSALNRTAFARFHFYLTLLYHIELSFSPPPPKVIHVYMWKVLQENGSCGFIYIYICSIQIKSI